MNAPAPTRACAVDAIAALDLDAAKAGLAAQGWPRYLANEIELEYRRFLLLLALHPSEPVRPAPLIAAFLRCHEPGFDGLDARWPGLAARVRTAPPPATRDPATMALYATEFPGRSTS